MDINWIDVPVQDAIGFFTDTIGYFTMVALRMGKILSLLGIAWVLIQMALGTMEARKALVGTLTKFIFFIVIMTVYPAATRGLCTFANALGREASPTALSTVTQSLVSYMNSLEQLVDEKTDDLEKMITEREKLLQQIATGRYDTNSVLFWADDVNSYALTAQKELESFQKQKEAILKNESGMHKKIAAIKSVLKLESGKNLSKRYALDLDMKSLKNPEKSMGYLSPNAAARIGLLAAEIMYENEWQDDVMVHAYYSENDWEKLSEEKKEEFKKEVRLGKKSLDILHFPVGALFRLGLVVFCCLFMLLTVAGCMIQYIMAIIEYFISSSVGIVIVPCMLFDGLNDMAQKVLPMLLAQALKLTMITMCMMFNVYTYLKMAMEIINTSAQFGFSQMFSVLFTSFLTFILVVNAPKLATTILTGQPQMSMGEFMQAAGAVAAGYRGTEYAFHRGAEATAGAARFGANRLGDTAAMLGAAKRGWDAEGGGARGLAHAGLSAAGELGSRTGKRIRAGASNFVHGGGSGGRGRGFGGGGSGGGTADIMSAGNQAEVNAKNQVDTERNTGANVRDASNREMSKMQDNPDLIGAMNYADARTNSGNYMSFGDYLKTQYNTAAGKEVKPLPSRYYINKDGIPVVKQVKKMGPVYRNGTWYQDGKPVPPPAANKEKKRT